MDKEKFTFLQLMLMAFGAVTIAHIVFAVVEWYTMPHALTPVQFFRAPSDAGVRSPSPKESKDGQSNSSHDER